MPGRNLVIDKEIVISTCFFQGFRQNKIIVKVASENIRVNCIAPGIIKTKFAEVILCPSSMVSSFLNFAQKWRIILYFSKALTDNEDIADKALENLPLGR